MRTGTYLCSSNLIQGITPMAPFFNRNVLNIKARSPSIWGLETQMWLSCMIPFFFSHPSCERRFSSWDSACSRVSPPHPHKNGNYCFSKDYRKTAKGLWISLFYVSMLSLESFAIYYFLLGGKRYSDLRVLTQMLSLSIKMMRKMIFASCALNSLPTLVILRRKHLRSSRIKYRIFHILVLIYNCMHCSHNTIQFWMIIKLIIIKLIIINWLIPDLKFYFSACCLVWMKEWIL